MKRKLQYDENPNKIVRAEGEFDDLTYSPEEAAYDPDYLVRSPGLNIEIVQLAQETGLTPFLRELNIQAAVGETPVLRWGNMELSEEDATPLLGLANIQQPAVAYMFPNMSELPANNHLVFNYNDLFDYVPGNLNPEFIGEMVACKAH